MIEQSTPELPPLLPEDRETFYAHMNQLGLTLKQADALYGSSLAYGIDAYAAGVAAGMEKAAKICREKADGIRRVNTWRGKVNQPSGFAADMVDDAADQIGSAAIRMGEQ